MLWHVLVGIATPAPGDANPDEPAPLGRTRHVPPHCQACAVRDRLLDHHAAKFHFHHVGADGRLAPERLRTNVGVAVSCPAGAVPVAAFEPSSVLALAIDPIQVRKPNRARVQQDIRVVSAGPCADDASAAAERSMSQHSLGAKAVVVRHGPLRVRSVILQSGSIASHHRCGRRYAAPALTLRRLCVPLLRPSLAALERTGVVGALAFSMGISGLAVAGPPRAPAGGSSCKDRRWSRRGRAYRNTAARGTDSRLSVILGASLCDVDRWSTGSLARNEGNRGDQNRQRRDRGTGWRPVIS